MVNARAIVWRANAAPGTGRRRASLLASTFAAALVLAPAAAGAGSIVTGLGNGGAPQVSVFDAASAVALSSFLAYTPSFTGGVRVATGDVNGDGRADIVTGSGPGSGPHVKVFDGASGLELRSFFAFDPGFTGGVFVAAGDVTGDGRADLIAGADAGGGPHVKVFDAVTGAEVRSFFAYTPGFPGGVRVAAGDVNGDGRADIVTAAGPGAGPHVKVFDGVTGAEIRSFFAFDPGFGGGVFVAAGDVNGDGRADLVAGADAGAVPHVKVFDGATTTEIRSFFAYDPGFAGGVRVAAGDVNGDGRADVITGAGPGGGPHVKVFSGVGGAQLQSFFATSPAFAGGVYVAAIAAPRLDRQPPVLTVPPSITAHATTPDGAVVTFTVSAVDDVDGPVPATCTPPSGSTFPIGDTTVSCTASDFAGNVGTASFVVHVNGPPEQLDGLHELVASFGLDRHVEAPLQNKVAAVEAAIAAGGQGCAELDELLLAAISRAAKGELPFADAAELVDAANEIEAAAGCLPVGSSLPAVQRALIGLLDTVDSLGLPRGEAALLAEQTRKAADAAVAGDPCPALHDLDARIAADTGKAGKLTAAQGATLSVQVAAIAATAGCD